MRKLLPALYHRNCDEQIPADSRIIAVGRHEMTREAYVESVKSALLENLKKDDFLTVELRCVPTDAASAKHKKMYITM